MKMFKDSKGREWNLNLSLAAAQRIDACDFSDLTDRRISVLNMHEADCMDVLLRDAAVTFACIWCCVKPQADELGVDQEEFVESLGGSAIADGKEAWVEELADFFPELRTALLSLKQSQEKGLKKVQKRSEKLAKKMAEQVDGQLDIALDKAEREVSGQTFG